MMRLALQIALILSLWVSRAMAADGTLTLQWSAPAPEGAEAVVTFRTETGKVALSTRVDVAEGETSRIVTYPPVLRSAVTVQAGLVHDGDVIAQGPVRPVEEGLGPDRSNTLSESLAIGFSDVWECEGARALQVAFLEEGLRVDRGAERMHFAPNPEVAQGFMAEDGSRLVFDGNRAVYTGPDGVEEACAAGLFPALLPLAVAARDSSWRFDLTRDAAQITVPGLEDETLTTEGLAISAPRDGTITLRSAGLTLRLTDTRCRRPEADLIYPFTADLSQLAQITMREGCAGNPLDLLGGAAWQVTRLLGQELDPAQGQELTLEITRGRISGRSTCNRYVGSASTSEGVLMFRELGTTRLSCPPDRRNIELRFLDALEAVTGFDLSPSGILTLRAGAQTILTARRSS